MIKDSEGMVTVGTYESKQLRERLEQLQKDYVRSCKDWLAAKREAERAGQPFDLPRPSPPKHKKVTATTDKSRAETVAAKLRAQYEEYLARKQAEEAKAAEEAAFEKAPPAKDAEKPSEETPPAAGTQDAGPKGASTAPDVQASGPLYYVLEVRHHDGRQTVEVVSAPELSSRIIQLHKEYMRAKKAWEAAKKDLGEALEAPEPLPPRHKSTKVLTREEAQRLAQKLRKKTEGTAEPTGETEKP